MTKNPTRVSAALPLADVTSMPDRAKNPSRRSKRTWLFVTTLLGLLVAARLAAYQLRVMSLPSDPLFGPASAQVLDSPLSRLLPVPDAVLGTVAYAVEAILLLVGDDHRYTTMPSVVLAYTALAFAMGLTAVGLVLYQVAILRAGCTWCLVSALLSIGLAVPAASEGHRALAQVLARRAGRGGRA